MKTDLMFKPRTFSLIFTSCLLLLVLGMASVPGFGQAAKPLTSADLLQMKTSGFDDQTIVNAIAANGVALDTSVNGLIALKQSGLSETVIGAALAAAAPKPSSSAPTDPDVPDEAGAYTMVKDALTPLPVEVVNFKTAGTLGMAFSYGLKKAKLQGTVPGEKSAAQLAAPITFVLRCIDGTAPAEYQLIPLSPKNGSREFTESKIGVTGASGGVDNQAVSLNFQRIGHDTYKAVASGLKPGEYGFLAPGGSTNGTSTGKLYTFGIGK